MQSVNFVIFGLSLRTLNDLKQNIIRILPPDVEVNWANISMPNLDALFINDAFYDAPSIQHLIQNKNLNVLKLINNESKQGAIEESILYLPVLQPTSLAQWLQQTVLVECNTEVTHEHVPQQPAESEIITHDFSKLKNVLKEIQNPHNGKIQVFDRKGVLAIVDPRTEWVWIHPDRQDQMTDETLNYTYAKMSDTDAVADVKQTDLKTWLWHMLWQSAQFLPLAQSVDAISLDSWPQPLSQRDRRDVLRMAACFSQGASLKQVSQHLDIDQERVMRFIAASLGTDFAQVISADQIQFQKKTKTEETPSQEDTGFMRKLFGSIRRRFGF